jgi:hypothetical protein
MTPPANEPGTSEPGAKGSRGGDGVEVVRRDRQDRRQDRRLLRWLHGELAPAEARELEAELGRDSVLRARLAELERLWRGLEPPAVEAPAPGEGARLARATLERERRRRERPLGWLVGEGLRPAPAWGRPLVAGALAAGLALGLWIGQPDDAATAGEGRTMTARRASGAEDAPPPAVEQPPSSGGEAEGDRIAAASEGPARVEDGRAAAEPEAGPSEERVAATVPRSPQRAPATPPREAVEDDAALDAEPLFAGEMTLAEAYLEAMEAGDAYDWEGSGP